MASGILSRKRAAGLRRIAILEAARAVFARQGYENTVVGDIAAQAGIGKGTLYLYFPSKEQVYLAALLDDARRLDAETHAAMSAAQSWRDAIRGYVEVRLRYLDAHQDFLRIYMTEFRGMCLMGKPLTEELYRLMENGEAQLAQAFEAAIARGEVRTVDPKLAACTVSDLTRGLMERRLRPGGRPVQPGHPDALVDLVCRALEA